MINPQWLELPMSRTNFKLVPKMFEPLRFDCKSNTLAQSALLFVYGFTYFWTSIYTCTYSIMLDLSDHVDPSDSVHFWCARNSPDPEDTEARKYMYYYNFRSKQASILRFNKEFGPG